MGAVVQVVTGRTRDLGQFSVQRVLPAPIRRTLGPFVFFDHFGPVGLPSGEGMDVRPHPHLHLATVTYLFEGEIFHRDSLGTGLAIAPGAVNWMQAGPGIVHSERSPAGARARGPRLHGLQSWVGLPRANEDDPAFFSHHPADTLPELTEAGATVRVLAGNAFGARSPVPVASPTLYAEVRLAPGARTEVPTEHVERGVYLVEGDLSADGQPVAPRVLAVLGAGAIGLSSVGGARFVLLGGEPLDGPRFIWWNFVSSDKDRIVSAAADWKAGRFAKIPGDDQEFIPLEAEPTFL